MTESLEIFCAYAHEDEPLRSALAKHLSALKRQGLIASWHDREINAGKEWAKEIDTHLNSAQIILLLVSPDFLYSDYCYGVELKRAMERHKQGEASVIPVIVRPVDWEQEPLGQLKVLPFDGRPVTSWPNQDEAFLEIAKGLRKVVEEIREMHASSFNSTHASASGASPINIDSGRKDGLFPLNFQIMRTKARIKTPSLILLLGTTSAFTGLELMRQMLSLQESIDRQRIALVYIDTDDPPAELVQFRQEHKSLFQEFPLRIAVPDNIRETEMIEQIEGGHTTTAFGPEPHTFIEKRIPQSSSNGTGGIRNDGHVAACYHYDRIHDTLDCALDAIIHSNTEGELPGRFNEVQVNIVAFLGGGTAGGVLTDMAVLVREMLSARQLKQRLNLFCMLPGPVKGISPGDLYWRKSNATACLLELLAFSRAAVANSVDGKYYRKYIRDNVQLLTEGPIANEIYLVGRNSMDDASDITRLVGLDLFQRITDASGVGFLEHSKYIDRRSLGGFDDHKLPKMFSTTCPLDIRFPIDEVITCFAQISASHLLLELENYQPPALNTNVTEEQQWLTKWNDILDFHVATSKSVPITLPTFQREEFVRISQTQLNDQWYKLEIFEHDIERNIKAAFRLKRQEEEQRIDAAPKLDADSIAHLRFIYQHIQYLQKLREEYKYVLAAFNEKPIRQVPPRPIKLENSLLSFSLKRFFRDYATLLCEAYNERIRCHAKATYYRLLTELLQDLSQQVEEALSIVWFIGEDVKAYAKKLSKASLTSQVWQGYLEQPHPNQRHLFALRTLTAQNGRNVAMERLYRWATGGDQWTSDDKDSDDARNELLLLGVPSSSRLSSKSALVPVKSGLVPVQRNQTGDADTWEPHFNYGIFVDRFVEHLRTVASGASADDNAHSNRQRAMKMLVLVANEAVRYFQHFYRDIFRDMNVFELLDKATTSSLSEQERANQISRYLLEHLEHMRSLMTSSIGFEAELWQQGPSVTLDTSIYLGICWQNTSERKLLERVLDNLGSLTNRGQSPIYNSAIDPHRLQLSYGQHGISLSTIRDFYLEQNSAMEAYLDHQQKWEKTNGKGSPPVHSSGEAQRLVWEPGTLGYDAPLPELVMRRPFRPM
jgi:Tubulin like/TIR domain